VVDAAAVRLEPALAGYAGRMAGAVHTPSESAADCRQLCEQLAALLARAAPSCATTPRCWASSARATPSPACAPPQACSGRALRAGQRLGKPGPRAPAGPAHSRLSAQGLQHHRGRRIRPHTGPR
jgi:hypothetical protein